MRFLILLAVLTFASATEFHVNDSNNDTCILLTVSGTLDLVAVHETDKKELNKTIDFKLAKVLKTSTCSVIKLDMGSSAEVWFKKGIIKTAQEVNPVSRFTPYKVFPPINETGLLTLKSTAFGNFKKDESYLCKSPVKHEFNTSASSLAEYTYTVSATTTDFQIQFGNITNDTFNAGPQCPQDKPVTTSTASPVTTPTPGPNYFTVSDTNKTCINMTGTFSLFFKYQVGKEKLNYTAHIPQNAKASGSCEVNQTLDIYFDPGLHADWKMQFTFVKEVDAYYISEVSLTYAKLPNTSTPANKTLTIVTAKDYLKATTKGYYTCQAKTDLNLNKNITDVILTFSKFSYLAYNDKKDAIFSGNVVECPADQETSSVVPIAVGAALAGLVVIVLIAYLIGRRRSRKSGYESV